MADTVASLRRELETAVQVADDLRRELAEQAEATGVWQDRVEAAQARAERYRELLAEVVEPVRAFVDPSMALRGQVEKIRRVLDAEARERAAQQQAEAEAASEVVVTREPADPAPPPAP